MRLQTLLVSKDDPTAETLVKVLAQFGVAVERSNAVDIAMTRLTEERFDQVIVDFDDPEAASQLLAACRSLIGREQTPPVTVALLREPAQMRSILGAGAHFILMKPVSCEQAQKTFRAVTVLLQRERRKSLRVDIQAEISLRIADSANNESDVVEGIILDLSTGGMEVLAAKPLPPAAALHISFQLPGSGCINGTAEVAWTAPNGQIGLRLLDLDATMRQQLNEWLGAHSHDFLPGEPDAINQCKLTDLSLGGCYVQTESPFPQSSSIDLCLRVPGMEVHAEGLVRVMHPGHGMGIEFPARTEEQRKSVGDFIQCLTGQPDAAPQLETSPRSLVANAIDLSQVGGPGSEAEDPLLDLLRNGQTLDEEAFLTELRRHRTPATAAQ